MIYGVSIALVFYWTYNNGGSVLKVLVSRSIRRTVFPSKVRGHCFLFCEHSHTIGSFSNYSFYSNSLEVVIYPFRDGNRPCRLF